MYGAGPGRPPDSAVSAPPDRLDLGHDLELVAHKQPGALQGSVPERSPDAVAADLRRMKQLGCNTVYLPPNNDTIAHPNGIEPGLAPAVWYALTRFTSQREDAWRIYQAILDVLDASLKAGLEVVLSIGYQIQMGEEWNEQNRDQLRRGPDQRTMNHWRSGETASPYSERYREDIQEYYRWVDEAIVRRYSNIVALNLADEPMGSDFSPHAMAAFEARYGKSFVVASSYERGEFLSGVIADYASWSADIWKRSTTLCGR